MKLFSCERAAPESSPEPPAAAPFRCLPTEGTPASKPAKSGPKAPAPPTGAAGPPPRADSRASREAAVAAATGATGPTGCPSRWPSRSTCTICARRVGHEATSAAPGQHATPASPSGPTARRHYGPPALRETACRTQRQAPRSRPREGSGASPATPPYPGSRSTSEMPTKTKALSPSEPTLPRGQSDEMDVGPPRPFRAKFKSSHFGAPDS